MGREATLAAAAVGIASDPVNYHGLLLHAAKRVHRDVGVAASLPTPMREVERRTAQGILLSCGQRLLSITESARSMGSIGIQQWLDAVEAAMREADPVSADRVKALSAPAYDPVLFSGRLVLTGRTEGSVIVGSKSQPFRVLPPPVAEGEEPASAVALSYSVGEQAHTAQVPVSSPATFTLGPFDGSVTVRVPSAGKALMPFPMSLGAQTVNVATPVIADVGIGHALAETSGASPFTGFPSTGYVLVAGVRRKLLASSPKAILLDGDVSFGAGPLPVIWFRGADAQAVVSYTDTSEEAPDDGWENMSWRAGTPATADFGSATSISSLAYRNAFLSGAVEGNSAGVVSAVGAHQVAAASCDGRGAIGYGALSEALPDHEVGLTVGGGAQRIAELLDVDGGELQGALTAARVAQAFSAVSGLSATVSGEFVVVRTDAVGAPAAVVITRGNRLLSLFPPMSWNGADVELSEFSSREGLSAPTRVLWEGTATVSGLVPLEVDTLDPELPTPSDADGGKLVIGGIPYDIDGAPTIPCSRTLDLVDPAPVGTWPAEILVAPLTVTSPVHAAVLSGGAPFGLAVETVSPTGRLFRMEGEQFGELHQDDYVVGPGVFVSAIEGEEIRLERAVSIPLPVEIRSGLPQTLDLKGLQSLGVRLLEVSDDMPDTELVALAAEAQAALAGVRSGGGGFALFLLSQASLSDDVAGMHLIENGRLVELFSQAPAEFLTQSPDEWPEAGSGEGLFEEVDNPVPEVLASIRAYLDTLFSSVRLIFLGLDLVRRMGWIEAEKLAQAKKMMDDVETYTTTVFNMADHVGKIASRRAIQAGNARTKS